jgi:hypothetical protein
MKSSSIPVVIARLLIILSLLAAILPSVAYGQVSFFTPPTYAGNGAVFVADFNGDGKPDILTGDGTLNLGNGDGTFTAGTPVAGAPLAVADFNGDGKPDVLEQATGTLLVLLGNGDGTFQPPISTNSGASLSAVVAGDVNGDGKADVLGLFNNNLVVYLSKGDGTFAAGVSYPVGNTSIVYEEITLGDFNSDQKADVAVSLSGDNVVGQEVVFLGNGDGTFQSGTTSTGVLYPSSVVAGDFNGDGKLDLVIAGQPSLSAVTSILLGNGDGTFQTPTTVVSNGGILAAADLNDDGKVDFVLLNGLAQVYLGKGDGTFSNTHSYQPPVPQGLVPGGLALADFNLDGKVDVAAAGGLMLGNGDGTFKGWSAVALPLFAGSSTAVGDFDKNGAPDIAAVSTNSVYSVYILTNDGTGVLSLAHTYPLQQPGYAIATADLNGDGNLDLVVEGVDPISQDWSFSVLLGNGDGTFQSAAFYPQNVGADGSTVVIADFNGDGKPDLAIPAGSDSVAVLLGKGNGTFFPPTYFFDGGGSIVSADFNLDAKLDIVSGAGGVLLGEGDGTFQPAMFPVAGFGVPLLTADVNGDGKPDIVGGNAVFLGNGDGTFKPPILIGEPEPTAGISLLADVNGDGKVDAIGGRSFSSQFSDRGLFLGNGDGTFGPYITLLAGSQFDGGISFAQAADMNGDGKQDLVVIDGQMGSIFVLINTTVPVPGTKFSPASVTFPAQTVGTSSNPTPVMLTNTGAVALTVKSVTFGGAGAGEFKQTNNCTTVEPLENCTINVTFAPTATGGSSANLIVTDNAGTGSQQVVVSGTGAAVPGFTVSAAAPSPEPVAAGGVATSTVTITSVGGFNQSVTLSCASITLNGSTATTAPPTCKFSPSSVSDASGTSTLRISTTGPSAALVPVPTRSRLFYALLLPICGVALMGTGFNSRKKKVLGMVLTSMMILGLLVLAACGGGNSGGGGGGSGGGTPAGSYTISISGSAGSLVSATKVTLTVQ